MEHDIHLIESHQLYNIPRQKVTRVEHNIPTLLQTL
jgi:hypothetical protein